MKKFFVLSLTMIISAFLQSHTCKAVQDYFEDTVWVKKTDQLSGFYQVKMSNTDSMIVAHGYSIAYVYKTLTGEQIARLPFNGEVHFFNQDKNFIQLAPSRDRLIVFETKEFKAIDTLEFDGETIADIDISKDEKYLVAVVASGYRIWSLNTRKILKTKTYKAEEYQTNFQIEQITITNDNSKIITSESRTFYNPNNPNGPYSTFRHNIYDFNTIDSLGTFNGMAYYRLSNTNKYIAFKCMDKYNGVEIYKTDSKELVQTLQINGPSLTGMEFSPDDKYLVTSNGPGTNALLVWSIETGKIAYDYPRGSVGCIDVSNNGKYIVSSTGKYFFLWNFKNEMTDIKDKVNIIKTIYPNPTNGNAIIEFEQKITSKTIISLIDLEGKIIKTLFNEILEEGKQELLLNMADIANGNYYIIVKNEQESLLYNLIINN